MKRLITLGLIAFGLIAFQVSVKAQETGPQTGPRIPPPPRASRPDLERVPVPTPAPARNGSDREEKVIAKGILAPSENDASQHQFLLSQEKTGLLRLLPRESFDWEVYKVRNRSLCEAVALITHSTIALTSMATGRDISFEKGNLSVRVCGSGLRNANRLWATYRSTIVSLETRACTNLSVTYSSY